MAQAVKVLIGFGSLDAGADTWWSWYVTDNDVWHFWVDVHGGTGTVLEIVHVQNQRQSPRNLAWINIKNHSPKTVPFSLNVARIF
jgi:hypothetical protein